MSIMFVASCLLILHLFSQYIDALYSYDSKVKELYDYNYKESLDNTTAPVMLVEFYAPWCKHCKALVPTIEGLAKELSFYIPVCSVNCEEHRDICEKFNIQGFPTLKIGYISQTSPTIKKSWVEYNEDRTTNAIKRSLYKYCPSAIKPLSTSDAPSVLRNRTLKAYVFASSEEDLIPVNFLAWKYQSFITIYNGLSSRQTIKGYFNLTKFPFLLVQRTDPSPPDTLFIPDDRKLSSTELYNLMDSFLSRYIISLPELNTSDDFARYCLNANAPICLIALIHDPYSEQSLNRIRILENIATTSTNVGSTKATLPFSFMWINRDVHDDVMINYDPETYQEKTDPDLLIFNNKREKFGAWFGGDSWDKQSILAMLDEIKLGNARLTGDPPQFHPFYEWISAGKDNEKQDL